MSGRLIFISRAPGHKALAQAVADALATRQASGWANPLADPETGLLDRMSMQAMERADTVLVLVSGEAANSERVERELIVANQLSRPIAAVSIDGAAAGQLEPHLANAQRLGTLADPEAIAAAIAGPRPVGRPAGKGRGLLIGLGVGAGVLVLALLATVAILVWPTSDPSAANRIAATNAAAPLAPDGDPTRDADRAVASRDREARSARDEEEPMVSAPGDEDAPPMAPVAPPPDSTTRPARLVGGSISDLDYPPAAVRAGEEGIVAVSYVVGTDGRVTTCSVTSSSGSAALDTASCNLVRRRFRFLPALDYGEPVAETRSQRIVWRLPED